MGDPSDVADGKARPGGNGDRYRRLRDSRWAETRLLIFERKRVDRSEGPQLIGSNARRRSGWAALALLALAAACAPLDTGHAPSPSATISVPIIGDEIPQRDGVDVLRVAAVGDIGDGSASAAEVASAIARFHRSEPIDVLLLLGDLIYPSGNPGEYESKFARVYGEVLNAGIEVRAILGNHDIETDPGGMMRAFRIPERDYHFDSGPARFIGIDTSRGTVDSSQTRWLEGALATDHTWKIVFTHVPSYSSGMHGSNVGLQRVLDPVFDRFDLDLQLAAHDHNYERTKAIHGVAHIVSGGGCCPRNVARSPFTEVSAGILHFVILDIRTDRMNVRAVDVEGKVFDQAVLNALAVTPAA